MSEETKFPIEIKIKFSVSDLELDKLRITPERYARFIRDSIAIKLLGRAFVQHNDVEVTVEH